MVGPVGDVPCALMPLNHGGSPALSMAHPRLRAGWRGGYRFFEAPTRYTNMRAIVAPALIHGRPRFAKHSLHDVKKVTIAAIHPDFE